MGTLGKWVDGVNSESWLNRRLCRCTVWCNFFWHNVSTRSCMLCHLSGSFSIPIPIPIPTQTLLILPIPKDLPTPHPPTPKHSPRYSATFAAIFNTSSTLCLANFGSFLTACQTSPCLGSAMPTLANTSAFFSSVPCCSRNL